MSIPMAVILALLLAGILVPVTMLLTPATLRGDWIAVVVAALCVAFALMMRHRASRQ